MRSSRKSSKNCARLSLELLEARQLPSAGLLAGTLTPGGLSRNCTKCYFIAGGSDHVGQYNFDSCCQYRVCSICTRRTEFGQRAHAGHL
jgi:hypothetical protein